MKLNIFENYEILDELSRTLKLEHKCGEFFVEILNNYKDIKTQLDKSIQTILENKTKRIIVDDLKYLLPTSYSNLTQNMTLFYLTIQVEFQKINAEFENNKKYFQKKLKIYDDISKAVENTSSVTEEDKTYISEQCNLIKNKIKQYNFEQNINIQLEYLDSLNYNLKLTLYFINEYEKLKDEYHFKSFEIPREIISCVIKKGNTIRLLESKENILCGSVKERNYIEKTYKNEIKILNSYEIEKVNDLFEIYRKLILDKKLYIKKCKNCGKYFIPENRSDEKYCNNISPQNPNKTCKEYGAKKTYRDNIKSRPLKDEHYKTSQFFRMRIKRNKDKNNIKEIEELEKKFDQYKLEYEKNLKQYNNNELTEEDFKDWIIKQKDL